MFASILHAQLILGECEESAESGSVGAGNPATEQGSHLRGPKHLSALTNHSRAL